MTVGLGAAHPKHQDMESDRLCNNIGLYFSAAMEFKAIRGGKSKAGDNHTNRKRDHDIRKKKKLIELIGSGQCT